MNYERVSVIIGIAKIMSLNLLLEVFYTVFFFKFLKRVFFDPNWN